MYVSTRRTRGCLRFAAKLLLVGIACLAESNAHAQITRSWNRTSDGNWAFAGNWSPDGIPENLDVVRIGNLAGVADTAVFLNANDIVSEVHITNGMGLSTSGNTLAVLGDTFVSGNGSYIAVTGNGVGDNYDTDILEVSDQAGVRLIGGTLEVDEQLVLNTGTLVSGQGIVRLIGNGTVLVNNGQIDPSVSGLVIDITGGGELDLDGTTGNGFLDLSIAIINPNGLRDNLTINGGTLTDAFDGEILFDSEARLNMNLAAPWTLGSGGEITFRPRIGLTGPAELNGVAVTLNGAITVLYGVTTNNGYGQFNADATLEAGSSIEVGNHGRLELNGATTINGGTFTTEQNANIDFNGPTTIHGGTFNTFSTNINDGDVDFNGPTTWAGDVTINGIAQQQGDATVSASSVITADAFDMDGSSGNTSWDINQRLEVHATRIGNGGSTFNGTLDIGGVLSSRLLINVDNSSQPEWTMGGTMNLGGIVVGIVFVDRLFGSRVIVTGEVNVVNRAGIAADAVFTSDSTLNFNTGVVSPVLRMSGHTTIEAGATLVGPGELENAVGGTMSLEAGLTTGLVGVTNRGRLELGETVGVVSVPVFENVAGATLVVDVGRNTLGTDSDVLTISSGAADLAGFLQPNIVNIGGVIQRPQVGNSFTVLTAVGGVNGTFDEVLDSLHGGLKYEWDPTYNPSNVVIELAAISGLLGDYNGDGTVNAADYVVWRDTLASTTILAADGNLNSTIDQPDYGVWSANFGAVLGKGTSESVTVPEPSTLVLVLLTGVGCGLRRRRTI